MICIPAWILWLLGSGILLALLGVALLYYCLDQLYNP